MEGRDSRRQWSVRARGVRGGKGKVFFWETLRGHDCRMTPKANKGQGVTQVEGALDYPRLSKARALIGAPFGGFPWQKPTRTRTIG